MIPRVIKQQWMVFVTVTILIFIAFIGMRGQFRAAEKARYEASRSYLENISDALHKYSSQHGKFPDLPNFQTIAAHDSPLKLRYDLPLNYSLVDPWGQQFEGQSNPRSFVLFCKGSPRNSKEYPAFEIRSSAP